MLIVFHLLILLVCLIVYVADRVLTYSLYVVCFLNFTWFFILYIATCVEFVGPHNFLLVSDLTCRLYTLFVSLALWLPRLMCRPIFHAVRLELSIATLFKIAFELLFCVLGSSDFSTPIRRLLLFARPLCGMWCCSHRSNFHAKALVRFIIEAILNTSGL